MSLPDLRPESASSYSSEKQTEKNDTSDTVEKEWTEEFIKQTIDEMDKNLQNVLQNGELMKFKKRMYTLLQGFIIRWW